MASPRETYVPSQAAQYFAEIEMLLLDLGFARERIIQEMLGLPKEFRRDFRKSRLILYLKRRNKKAAPRALYWGKLCRARNELSEVRAMSSGSLEERWKLHIPRGHLTHDLIFLLAHEVGREALILEYDRRAFALNQAYRQVGIAIMSLEHTLLARTERRSWESGDLDADAPAVSPDLRPQSRKALGAGWFYILRAVAIEYELIASAERYNADPVYEGFRLSFGRDIDHPFGRIFWLLWGERLPRLNDAEGARENLTDRVMRKLHLPEAVRQEVARHELHRRKMTRLHQRYTGVLGGLKRTARGALAAADSGLLAAQPRPPRADPVNPPASSKETA